MLQVPTENVDSPGKSCPKSPLKRMKALEEQETKENVENIEAIYEKQNSPEKDDVDPKYLLGSKCQNEGEITETQEAQKVIEIDQVLEVDSNVINYGQFICGKILGSTL